MVNKVLLTLEEFKRAAKQRRLSDTSKEAARMVLVDGVGQSEVAALVGVTSARISQIVATVREEHEKLTNKQVKTLEADYAIAVNLSRAKLGDSVVIAEADRNNRYVGKILVRTDFYAVQEVGKGVVIHDLSRLDNVPSVGSSVGITYENGRGLVKETVKARPGLSL